MYYVYWLWLCDRLIHNDVMCDLALPWHRWHCHIWSPINMCGAGLVWVTSVQCQWHPHSHTDDPGHTGPHIGDRTQGQGLPLLLLLLPFIWVSGIIDSGNFSSGGLVAVSVNRHFGWVRKFDFFIGLRLCRTEHCRYCAPCCQCLGGVGWFLCLWLCLHHQCTNKPDSQPHN